MNTQIMILELVIYALNWLILNYASEIHLFSETLGSSTVRAKYDVQTVFRLIRKIIPIQIVKVSIKTIVGETKIIHRDLWNRK